MRRINRCLNPQLVEICQNAMELESLNSLVKTFLPSHLTNYCNVGSFIRGSLTLTIPNANWATELRYLIPELRDKLRKDAGLYQLTGIKIGIIENAESNYSKKSKKKLSLSNAARTAIYSASEQCDYEPLKTALRQLATQEE